MQFTHTYKSDYSIQAFDIRPEAITESRNKRIAKNFENRSCGDVFAWKDGETGTLLGINKKEHLYFLSATDGRFIYYKGDYNDDDKANESVPVYLKVPKQEIKWHAIKEPKASKKENSSANPKTEKKDEPSTKTEQSPKEFSMQYTHAYKANNGDVDKYDVRPEAIANNPNQMICENFKNRSCGDNFYCHDDSIRVLMGIDRQGLLSFVSARDNTLSFYGHGTSLKPPIYLSELPKAEIKWHSIDPIKEPEKKDEPAPQTTQKSEDQLVVLSGANNNSKAPKRKRKDFELEIDSDEDIGEIKFVRPSDKRIYSFTSGAHEE